MIEAKYKLGDTVTFSDEYFRQGFAVFGKELRHHSQKKMNVLKVYTEQAGEKDSLDNIIPVIYEVKIGSKTVSFCEQFLKKLLLNS